MAALSRLDLCNLAIAQLPAAPIATLDENSLEARECRRIYPQVIAEMLEGPHDFSFGTKRVILASLINDRAQEWLYAYALPADMASPIRVIPGLTALGLGYPIPLPGEPYAETWAGNGRYFETPHIIAGSALYSNSATAALEYTVNDVAGTFLPSKVVNAIVLDLAARLAVPVKKDSSREQSLRAQAEVAWSRAIADDRNRQPEQSGQYISEAMLVRSGSII